MDTEARTRARSVQDTLEREILDGTLRPGTRLDEGEIAARFQVSRTPVREALRSLASAELVEVRPRQPAVVAQLSAQRVIEMFQVMAELEGLCARLAARRISSEEADQLQAVHEELVLVAQSGDPAAFYETNRRFHEAIYEASGNTFLAEQTRALRNRIGPYRMVVTRKPNRQRDTLTEHEEVLRCIRAGDEVAAARAMSGHVNLLGEKLLDFLALFNRDSRQTATQ